MRRKTQVKKEGLWRPNAKKNKINKHLLGGKLRRPFTGFERLLYYDYDPTSRSRENYYEGDYKGGIHTSAVGTSSQNILVWKESFKDGSVPEYYDDSGSSEQMDSRLAKSLIRHAMQNPIHTYGGPTPSFRFKSGGLIIKGLDGLVTPYKSTIGYANNRGGSYSSHKIYPTEDDYNNGRYYERRYYRNDFGDDNYYLDYNPNNLSVDYNSLDYSNTESSPGNRNSGNSYGYYLGGSSNQVGPSEYLNYLINGDEKYNLYDPNTVKSDGARSAFGKRSDTRYNGL